MLKHLAYMAKKTQMRGMRTSDYTVYVCIFLKGGWVQYQYRMDCTIQALLHCCWPCSMPCMTAPVTGFHYCLSETLLLIQTIDIYFVRSYVWPRQP